MSTLLTIWKDLLKYLESSQFDQNVVHKTLIRKLTIEQRGTRRTDICAPFVVYRFKKDRQAVEEFYPVDPKEAFGYR